MNVIAAMLLLIGCTALGYRKTEGLKKRKEILLSMRSDIRRISERMTVYPEPFSRLISRIEPATDILWNIFLDLLSADGSVSTLFEKAIHEAAAQKNGFELLQKEEVAILTDFGTGLASADLTAQQENAALAVKRLGEAAETLELQIKEKGRLFESLGLLSGLALALLVI